MVRLISALAAGLAIIVFSSHLSSFLVKGTRQLCTVFLGWAHAAPDAEHVKGPSKILATLDGQPITEKEAEEATGALLHQARISLYEAQRMGVEEVIAKRLLEREAKRRGITLERLLDTEVYAKVGEISPEEVKAFHTQNQARIQQPLEKVAKEIERHLKNQQAASRRASLVNELKKQSKIRFLLDPPRISVSDTGPSKGPATAPVTIVEFSDFQCPACARSQSVLKRVLDTYGDKVRLVYRDFPADGAHREARQAAEAARCAEEQGKFWEYHDKLFAHQQALQVADLKRYAEEVGLDGKVFEACLTSSKFKETIAKDIQAAQKAAVGGTPAFFINGRPLLGALPFEAFQQYIDEELERVAPPKVESKVP